MKDLYSTTTRSPASVAEISRADSPFDFASPYTGAGVWNFDELFPKNTLDPLMCKGEFVIVLLSELVQICPDAWKAHIPAMLVFSLITMDHSLPIVYESAKILLTNLIYCSVEEKLLAGSAIANSYQQFHKMIQDSHGNPLWNDSEKNAEETAEKVNSVVSLVMDLLRNFSPDIMQKASAESLQVASRINLSTHSICRALLIYRCIELGRFTSEDIHELMGVLLLHIQNRESRLQVSVVVEVQRVFEKIIEICSCDELTELPKIFWCGVALLRSDISRDYLSGAAILLKFLKKVEFTSEQVQRKLHQSYPYSWSPTFPGLSILLLKGFCSKEQERTSRQLMCRLITRVPSDIVDIDMNRSHVVFIVSMLPHLLTFLGGENMKSIAPPWKGSDDFYWKWSTNSQRTIFLRTKVLYSVFLWEC